MLLTVLLQHGTAAAAAAAEVATGSKSPLAAVDALR